MGFVLFLIFIILPMMITILVNRFSTKLLFLVPIIEFGAVSLFNAIITNRNGHGGVRFDIFFLIIGTASGIITPLISLITKKQHAVLIVSIVTILFILSCFLSDKNYVYNIIKFLPFYIGVIALSFQKDRK